HVERHGERLPVLPRQRPPAVPENDRRLGDVAEAVDQRVEVWFEVRLKRKTFRDRVEEGLLVLVRPPVDVAELPTGVPHGVTYLLLRQVVVPLVHAHRVVAREDPGKSAHMVVSPSSRLTASLASGRADVNGRRLSES